jgi:NADH/NAD ratio-sensing transcriptional regulator Rex
MIMSKAILTFEDYEDEKVKVKLEFDPPIEGDNIETQAQKMGVKMLSNLAQGQVDEDE